MQSIEDMAQVNERVIPTLAEVKVEERSPAQTGPLEDERIEQLSETLRAHGRVARQHRSSACIFHQSELAVWLGENRDLLDETLEFMLAKGWAGKSGVADSWWIT